MRFFYLNGLTPPARSFFVDSVVVVWTSSCSRLSSYSSPALSSTSSDNGSTGLGVVDVVCELIATWSFPFEQIFSFATTKNHFSINFLFNFQNQDNFRTGFVFGSEKRSFYCPGKTEFFCVPTMQTASTSWLFNGNHYRIIVRKNFNKFWLFWKKLIFLSFD